MEQRNDLNCCFRSISEMTVPRCAKPLAWWTAPTPEEALVMRGVPFGNEVICIPRFLDQRNNLNAAHGSWLRGRDSVRIKMSSEGRDSIIGLPEHVTTDAIGAAMAAYAICDEGIDRYLSTGL